MARRRTPSATSPGPVSSVSPEPILAPVSLRRITRFAALGAAGICLWLVVLKLTGRIDSVAGCGGADGCAQVLGGRWSAWLGVPVNAVALGFYAVLFVMTFPAVYARRPGRCNTLLTAAALSALGAAGWFLGVLFVVEKTFCPYCVTVHALGVLWAAPVLRRAVKGGALRAAPVALGGAATAVLALGQLFGPAPLTYQITEAPAVSAPVSAGPVVGGAKEISFLQGTLVYRPEELPVLGPRDAPKMLVEYFDYTCASCRDMLKDLKAAKAQLGGKVAVILLVCPLQRQCNPALPASLPDHAGACALANLSLAVWRKAPARFEAYHEFLMALPLPANEAAARAKAAELCGGEGALLKALADPWIPDRLRRSGQECAALSTKQTKMPKLLLGGNVVVHGISRDAAAFLAMLRQQLGL